MIINGTSGVDELYANKDNQVFGWEGDDILDASNGEGNNLLAGGAGSDRLFANNNDTLKGDAGEDYLYALGSLGFNTLEGGDDNDQLFVVEGGNNTLDGGQGSDRLIVLDGSGYNTLAGGLGNDLLDVSNGTGNNILYGNEGDDILIGGVNTDRLFGGAGDDLLFGGRRGSQLTGGTGLDRFFLTSAAVPEVPIEVLDFTKNDDKVIVAGIPEVRTFQDLQLQQTGADTVVKARINNTVRELGILRNIQANTLTPDDFDYTTAIFSTTNSFATEGTSITFTINRTADTQTQQTVTVSTSITTGDTASNTDFVAKTQTLTFEQGETQKTFTVDTTQDFLVEANESFTVSLSNPTNGAILSPTAATAKGTINDDDNADVIITQTGNNTIVTENGTTDSYTIKLTSQPTYDVIINISNGQQIRTNPRTLTFTTENWNVAQNVTVTAVDDFLVEGDGNDTITHTAISNDVNYNNILINPIEVGITDNDIPLFQNPNSDIFTIKGNSDKVNLQVTLTRRNSNFTNELSVFTVDDANGTINGIAPGAVGYTEAALQRARVIFSAIANNPNGFNSNNLASLLEFNSGDNLRFYLVRNSSTDAVLAGITPISDVVLANSSTQKITNLGTDGFSLGWEDGFGNNSGFADLVVKIQTTNQTLPLGANLQSQSQGELIDLRGVTQSVKADFVVNREAAFNNFIGFYQVTDENGGIDTNNDGSADILPGQSGYTQAAVNGRVPGIDLVVNNRGTATYTGTFQPGSLFAPFIIINSRPETILDNNPNNDPAVYFLFLGANRNRVDHIRLLANNVFGFEDLPNGGDKDFNDMIVRVNLSIA
ncbi:Na-Ca exchanger/integrin-beta4 [Trichormus variabilis ATCC 29413]|uniref:Na-Ca exchanger/integrin-beta4 n=2 Tax=Anabaena variabilis TaxID=264691 RepID=Q3M3W3_TRIV2|nr:MULTISPECIES: DUF4114 domain-containing protein [Nostocaceae]ABA24323.1 Na-Ca exchanger/integrin-beta4 [Trichormus variabilis ATCC 29413]MBC1215753.1 DUF4114 domain-containing protein [Trichormus variabilis ARAD]MBC1254142.1 DUF4114 domain-containing protein [Trichormus variabilis V5]MBC1267424.1 DUF4114 domain-containing protein [Trichormus variabilis FSR]MBC1301207.1 DUF4114 domain-containing protein [Trichormus variabilis N2B]